MQEEQNPLRHQIEQEVHNSEWFQKFKAWGTLLQTLKREIPLTQLCQLQWVTSNDTLLIHCPNPEVRAALQQQAKQIDRLNQPARFIILKHANDSDIVVSDRNADNG